MIYLKELDYIITEFLQSIGFLAPLIASILICVEAFIPFLPLVAFITVNMYILGDFWGFLLSWALACFGAYLVFKLFRDKMKKWFDKKIKDKEKMTKAMKVINNLKVEQLTLIVTLPFAPSFFINMIAGLSSINTKKFLTALIIGKIFSIYFWGFVGTSLLESFENPYYLLAVVLSLIVAFALSKFVSKTYGIE